MECSECNQAVKTWRTCYACQEKAMLKIADETREQCAKIAETWVDPNHSQVTSAVGCDVAFGEGGLCSAPSGIAAAIRNSK